MTLRFEQPEWLALLALAAPAVVLGLRWLVGMSPVRRWSAVLARLALIALVTGMLAGATAVRRTERLAVVAVIDISGSVQRLMDFGAHEDGRPIRAAEAARDYLIRAAKGRGPDDLLGVVAFDGSAIVVATPSSADVLGAGGRTFDLTMQEGTNIAEALRLAAAVFPPDATRRIVLFSDGNETAGRAADAAGELVGAVTMGVGDIPIDIVPFTYIVDREVVMESLDAPPQAPPGSTINVRVVLQATAPARGTLRLLREGEPVDLNGDESGTGRRLSLQAGRTVEVIPVRLDHSRVHRFQAIFEPDQVRPADGSAGLAGDTFLTNNRAEAFTISPGKGSVLVVDGVSRADPGGGGAVLGRTLAEAGIDVKTVPPEGLPTDLLSLQAFDLVILQNVPADAVARPVQEMLAAYVSDSGGGLVMVGGPASFGAGGWKGSALEPILPVRLDLPDKLIVPAAAIVLVLDNSGSMGRTVMGSSRSQQDIANEGAAIAVRSLDKTDLVGVIEFNSWYNVLVPLSPNADPAKTASIVRAITPDGGTNIPPAVEEAYRQLMGVDAQVKHVILLTDGISQDKEQLPGLAERMAADGITVDTIAVGDQADTRSLALMAERGGGAFYRVTDPNTLPRIFIKAIRVVRSPMIREVPFEPVVLASGSPIMDGVGAEGAALPALGGMVLTQPLADPTVTLAVVAPTGEPVLAHWSAGLGHVAAFTSDAHKWAAPWIEGGWPGYRRMWTQMVRQMSRPATDRGAELTTEIVGDTLRLRLDAADDAGRPRDLLTVPAKVYGPDGRPIETRLTQTGPGVYEGSVPAAASGTYVAMVTPRQGARALPPVVGGASRASGVEYRELRSNLGLLREVAQITGGRLLDLHDPEHARLFDRSSVRPTEARLPLWRTLLVWAVVVLLLDVGTRRIAWDRYLSKSFGADLRREAAEATRDRGAEAARATGRLRGRPARRVFGDGGAALSEEDARRIVREQAERRKAERLAARRAGKSAATSGEPVSKPDGEEKAGVPTSGLLAAKRRARERFEDEQKEEDRG